MRLRAFLCVLGFSWAVAGIGDDHLDKVPEGTAPSQTRLNVRRAMSTTKFVSDLVGGIFHPVSSYIRDSKEQHQAITQKMDMGKSIFNRYLTHKRLTRDIGEIKAWLTKLDEVTDAGALERLASTEIGKRLREESQGLSMIGAGGKSATAWDAERKSLRAAAEAEIDRAQIALSEVKNPWIELSMMGKMLGKKMYDIGIPSEPNKSRDDQVFPVKELLDRWDDTLQAMSPEQAKEIAANTDAAAEYLAGVASLFPTKMTVAAQPASEPAPSAVGVDEPMFGGSVDEPGPVSVAEPSRPLDAVDEPPAP